MRQKRFDLSKARVIAVSGLARMARDRAGLITTLVRPMVIILVLGAALSGAFSANSIAPFTVAVLSDDQAARPPAAASSGAARREPLDVLHTQAHGSLLPQAPSRSPSSAPSYRFGSVLTNDILGGADVRRVIAAKRVATASEGVRMVRSGAAVAFVQVPSDFSARALSGRDAEVRVLTDPGRDAQSGIVVHIVDAFTDSLTAGLAAGSVLGPQGAQELSDPTGSWAPTVRRVTTTTRDVKAIQYYAVAISITYMMMTAFNRGINLLREREAGTLQRALTSPTSKATFLAGHALGTMAIITCEFAILMLGTRLIYGVSWGVGTSNWLASMAIGVAFAFAATGLGLGTASVFNDVSASQGSVGLISNAMSALSGSMLPLYAFPASLRVAARFVPNYWALQGITDQMGGFTAAHMLMPVAVLVAVGLVSGSIGALRLAAH